MSGPEDSVFAQQERRAVAANARMPVNSRFWSSFYVSQLRNKLASGTYESRKVRRDGAVNRRRWAPAPLPQGAPLSPRPCLPLAVLPVHERERDAADQHVCALRPGRPAAAGGRRAGRASAAGSARTTPIPTLLPAGPCPSHTRAAINPACLPPLQHEVAIPLERAGACLEEVGREVYGAGRLWEGARTPFLVRFITGGWGGGG